MATHAIAANFAGMLGIDSNIALKPHGVARLCGHDLPFAYVLNAEKGQR